MDLAAGNWGRNSSYELYRPGPWRLFYGDWNGDGITDIIEAGQQGTAWLPLRDRRALASAFPDLASRFPTHEAYGLARVDDILGSRYLTTKFVEARHLESAVFLNRGGRFEPVPLPAEAQRTPVFGLCAGDLDGDGIEDLFLAQNFFGTASEHSREDAGCGLWLRGKGDGTFSAVDPKSAGIHIAGEQRGVALADFDHDGRVDVLVGVNNAPTRLYLNRGAKPGLRVELNGPPGNPHAVGAQMRLLYQGGRAGPVRADAAGSGYWSHSAETQVLGFSDVPVGLWVRWPGGKEQRENLASGEREVHLSWHP
jgi:hypothetical protein